MKYMLAICAAMIMLTVLETCEKEAERAAFTVKPAQPDTLALFGVSPLGDSSRSIFFGERSGKLQIESSLPVDVKSNPNVDWKRVREWSVVAGCSMLVALYYETPDSSLHIHCENPDTLYKRAGIRIPRRK